MLSTKISLLLYSNSLKMSMYIFRFLFMIKLSRIFLHSELQQYKGVIVMNKVVFVDGLRTPFGRMGGKLKTYYPSELLGMTIKNILDRNGIENRSEIAVYAGSALHDTHTNNFARFAALYAGLPYESTATFIEMQCGSGITCINHAALSLLNGDEEIIVAGGAESYSQRFAKFSMSVEPYKLIPPSAVPQMLAPSKEDSITMIEISDRMAEKWNVTREDCDAFACRSQKRAYEALVAGKFEGELFSIVTPVKKSDPIVCDADEQPRPNTTMEGLANLKAVREGGVTTAGNSSGRNDGASAVLMMTEQKAADLGLKPIAYWVGGAVCGVDPKLMGIGPAYSNVKLLKRFGLNINDIDVFECNEAFAAQNLSVIREMENIMGGTINQENWNPNGGAITFGHPNGASGARIATFAMKELARREGKYAMFSSCCGGGLGVSTLIERC